MTSTVVRLEEHAEVCTVNIIVVFLLSLIPVTQNPAATGSREPSTKVTSAIAWTREKVEGMTKHSDVKQGKPPLPSGQYYLVKPLSKKAGFVWETLTREEAERKLSCLSKSSLSLLSQDAIRKVNLALHYSWCLRLVSTCIRMWVMSAAIEICLHRVNSVVLSHPSKLPWLPM